MIGRMKLNGCAAVITGASSGLGKEFARQLAGKANRLLLVARRVEAMEALKLELLEGHPTLKVAICGADLGTVAGRATVVEWVRKSGFEPDVLINNAGLGDYGVFGTAEKERLREQVEVNISAVVELSHGLLPMLRRPGGNFECEQFGWGVADAGPGGVWGEQGVCDELYGGAGGGVGGRRGVRSMCLSGADTDEFWVECEAVGWGGHQPFRTGFFETAA